MNQILNYSLIRKSNPNSDLNLLFSPAVQITANSLEIKLTIFTDGVNIKKLTFKKELWPVWLQVADLPPKLRMARKNIVLAALYVGNALPDWNEIRPKIKSELSSTCVLYFADDMCINVSFKVKLLVCDLGAKSHVLNMFKFNGFFGCHYCTAEGKTIGRTRSYYPFDQSRDIREPVDNDLYINIAKNLNLHRSKITNVVGVKGLSAFSALIDGLPLAAPIDYMHCVLLGVFPEVLKLCVKTLSNADKLVIDEIVSN